MGTDYSSADGLVIQSATICEVSTTYTFTGDGKSVGIGGEPQEGYYFQLQAIDDAGNRSKLSPATYVYHDTVNPRDPDIDGNRDDIYVIGERHADAMMQMFAPDGTKTTEWSGKLGEWGLAETPMHLVFNDQYGDYRVEVTSYDSAGNKSNMVTRYFPKTQEEIGGIGGGSDISNNSETVEQVIIEVEYKNNTYIPVLVKLPKPKITKSYISENEGLLNVEGITNYTGQSISVLVRNQQESIQLRTLNTICKFTGFITRSVCQAIISELIRIGNLGSVKTSGSITSSTLTISHTNDSTKLNPVPNTSNNAKFALLILQKENISLGTNIQIRNTITAVVTINGKKYSIPTSIEGSTSELSDPYKVSTNIDEVKKIFDDAVSPTPLLSCKKANISQLFNNPKYKYNDDGTLAKDDSGNKIIISRHEGVDIANGGENCELVSIGDGVVTEAGQQTQEIRDSQGNTIKTIVVGYGTYVKIKHNSTYSTLYGHGVEGSIRVKVGETVKKGQIIMSMGRSGNSTGIHLHLNLYQSNILIDPISLLPNQLKELPGFPK